MLIGGLSVLLLLGWLSNTVNSLKYDPQYADYNLNTAESATYPIDYNGTWENHVYAASPDSWRFPFYTVMLDRFVNGDPLNDNTNGTVFEQDVSGTQLRFGGDISGLVDSLDYIQGMGIKGLYLAGSPLINQPWGYDSYSPLDNTLLDMHFGNITEWRAAMDEIHRRGMYVVMDNTMATMGDLIGFEGYLNSSAPFEPKEMPALYKTDRHYHDWGFKSEYNKSCDYFPRLYLDNGSEVGQDIYGKFSGCYNGDFDQYGDTEAFGFYPDYRRQLTKFSSVQDRLREWVPSVNAKLAHFSCLLIKMLDIDGFRYDKAVQVTVDAQANFSKSIRECARSVGKDNFFQPGEVTAGNTMGSIYIGRGRQPKQWLKDINTAANLTNTTTLDIFIRDPDHQALDSAAFHYSLYRYLVIFLGMDGTGTAAYDVPSNFVEAWNEILLSNDLVNANTGKTDPRHMYGTVNQDTFRWPAVTLGHERNLLGLFISTLHLPGIPLLMWGEEQAFYTLDNTATNYMYGRQPLSSAPAWQSHGCYSLPGLLYYQMPLDPTRGACHDDTVSWDHRDPSHPIRNIIKHMYKLREQFPVLQDGLWLEQLSNHTEDILYPGNSGVATTTGLFSVLRYQLSVQNLGDNVVPVWLLYSNRNTTWTYSFDCSNEDSALISPFKSGTRVKNLMFPHQEMVLQDSPKSLEYAGQVGINGCVRNVTMKPFEFRAYVPKVDFVKPPVMLTKFSPGHDYRIESSKPSNTVAIEFQASVPMSCDSFKEAISFKSTTDDGSAPHIDENSIECKEISQAVAEWSGAIASAWSWKANLINVAHGVHQIIVTNATAQDGRSRTESTDRFLFRVGAKDNPIVFPQTAGYSTTLLSRTGDGALKLSHTAAGATKFRYSTNWESSWSDWKDYETETTVEKQDWSGTEAQGWHGEHVVVQYFSKLLGTSAYKTHADLDFKTPRRIPHMFAAGPFNSFGYDAGLSSSLKQTGESTWEWHYMDEWPNYFQLSVWGINPDGKPDQSFVYGDVDGDSVLERLPPSSLTTNSINITQAPPRPYLAYRLVMDDTTMRYQLVPAGNMWIQLTLYLAVFIVPVLGGVGAVQAFKQSFYKVKLNEQGLHDRYKLGMLMRKTRNVFSRAWGVEPLRASSSGDLVAAAPAAGANGQKRRKILIATMEYNIDDWGIKIKIGGLGVMAQLMGNALQHHDLIWVVPCVGDVTYPEDQPAESVFVTILDRVYEIKVQYHQLDNITFVLLDAPIFRKQTKAMPYPPRMDDLESAIYYSAWNQCIAETINRFPIDIYHINDYHGALALLYLLPRTVPAALSLHNAEFQGMWPMRTPEESEEVCKAFNVEPKIVKKFCQYGSVFNLLNAGASYLRVYQKGFGAVGVSEKYGDRSFARYPIFWGLPKVGQLPNPDPTDTSRWDKDEFLSDTSVEVNQDYEASRSDLKRRAQEWAGLENNPKAELFVFVGRWSVQKGVDLIADIFPWVLERYPETQLICVGPVVDLYGRFAALKLSKLMELYPGRVYSKPEFTSLPPYIFSGAEFALIPSRDEPFGLVAVEFGRKGALGVGARVGGLGQMPGWWYTVESTKASYLIKQFKHAIESALETDQPTRAQMRAWSAKQRFPVAEWLGKLEKLHDGVIKAHGKHRERGAKTVPTLASTNHSRDSSVTPRDQVRRMSTSPTGVRQIPDLDDNATTTIGKERSRSRVNAPLMDSPQGEVMPPTPPVCLGMHDNTSGTTLLSMDEVVGDRQDYKLQQTDPMFTDPTGEFYRGFEKKLGNLTAKNSVSDLCLEHYLVKSEKEWFDMYLDAKLGRSPPSLRGMSRSRNTSPSRSRLDGSQQQTSAVNSGLSLPKRGRASRRGSCSVVAAGDDEVCCHGSGSSLESTRDLYDKQFALPKCHVPPAGIERYLQYRLGDWPVYAILLAINQVIASNSYQVALLTGEVGQTAIRLYIIASIYLGSSMVWYAMSRTLPLLYPLSLPYLVYGIAFLVLGCSPFSASNAGMVWLQNVAVGLYAFASSSGSLAFAFNFGTDGGSTVSKWIQRMAIVQGLTQLYSMGLWAWGSLVSSARVNNQAGPVLAASPYLLAVCLPIACLLWAVGLVLYVGLPEFYRESPGSVPQLWKTLLKRKTIAWYLFAVVVQNYTLSTLAGRNWLYLFSSKAVPVWAMVLLALAFFSVWGLFLFFLARATKNHPWLFPMFAVGLGAPRWAQIWWGTSGIGMWMPWAGGAVASAILSRTLWLWLGVLDGLQEGAVGMILMLTLTRVHVAAACVAAQVLGSVAVILARATAPNKLGPGNVFPDISEGLAVALSKASFWIVLGLQLLRCAGYFKFFRKEQVNKP